MPSKLEDKEVCGRVLPVSPPGSVEKRESDSEEARGRYPGPGLTQNTHLLATYVAFSYYHNPCVHPTPRTPTVGSVVMVAPYRKELLP